MQCSNLGPTLLITGMGYDAGVYGVLAEDLLEAYLKDAAES
ncbi:hypothetical protein [Methanomethylovorans sp.]